MMPRALRRLGRPIRRELSILKYRWRRLLGSKDPARVVPAPSGNSSPVSTDPAVGIVAPHRLDRRHIEDLLARQTETSWTMEPRAIDSTPWLWCPGAGIEKLEACHLESLLLTAEALDLEFAVGGWSSPEGPIGRPDEIDQATMTLLRRPSIHPPAPGPVHGALVPQISPQAPRSPVAPPTHFSAPFILNHGGGPGAVIRLPTHDLFARLEPLPPVPGPPTILFVAPYLAVGGAENLLFDLIEGLSPTQRVLVVTLDPHRGDLGQTVDRCRRLTPHTYTLGDWMPREACIGALRHLIRKWKVDVLVSWNGTVDFYDNALDLRHRFPGLRVLAQLYNHEGGWLDRTTPSLLEGLDGHLAVNARISRALVDKGAPPDRVHTVHHGVRVPTKVSDEERMKRRRSKRLELGLPEEAVVVGTFIRLHRQKRPLDIVRLARRLEESAFHFLLVGGGPEGRAVDAEIRRAPPSNLTRLPLQTETLHLYDALDLCLMTSDYEGLPIFLLDGLAREIPCVATAVGEIPELLRDGGGIAVEKPGDIEALAAGLLKLSDRELRVDEGRRGRQTVRDRFGLDAYVETYRRLFFPGGPA